MTRSKTSTILFAMLLLILTAVLLPVSVHAAEDTDVSVDNGIPVVYLNIDESRGTIEDMLSSPDHSVYCYGTISIQVPEGFHYSDFPDLPCKSLEGLSMSIRGRGNSTWNDEKKPFKIKLDKKTDVFGLGKNKHWVLVANAYDESLMKDRVTAWLGEEMGFSFTPRGVPVDLVMTGENYGSRYLGSYYLSENVRVDDNRLEIEELEAGDTDPDVITGGYLVQNGSQSAGSPDRFFTARGADWATHTPSFDPEDNMLLMSSRVDDEDLSFGRELGDGYVNPVQQQYIQNYMQMVEDVIFEGGTAYRDLFDMESTAKYWLIQEFTMNSDAFGTGSTYIYKYRNNGKFFWGPLWDFDYGYDKRFITAGFEAGHLWHEPMICDKEPGGFIQAVYQYWPQLRDALTRLTADGGVMDQYYAETKASAEQNYVLFHPGASASDFDYLGIVEHLKNWIISRTAWVDAHLSEIEDLVHIVTFMVDDEIYAVDYISKNEQITGKEEYPKKEGWTFLGWADEEGNIITSDISVRRDMVLTAQYVPDSELTHGEDIAFSRNCEVVEYRAYISIFQIPYTVLPLEAMDQAVEWSSSDEDYATVDADGLVMYHGPGEVTLTGKLKNGVEREFHLVVNQGEPAVPESISPDQETIHLAPGGQAACSIHSEPQLSKISAYLYESEDPEVVAAGERGVLTAVGPGRTIVHITAVTYTGSETIERETSVEVIVGDGEESGDPEPEDDDPEGDEETPDEDVDPDAPEEDEEAEPAESEEDDQDEDEDQDHQDDQGEDEDQDDQGEDNQDVPDETVPDGEGSGSAEPEPAGSESSESESEESVPEESESAEPHKESEEINNPENPESAEGDEPDPAEEGSGILGNSGLTGSLLHRLGSKLSGLVRTAVRLMKEWIK